MTQRARLIETFRALGIPFLEECNDIRIEEGTGYIGLFCVFEFNGVLEG